tara:strand:+ start:10444 stop:11133 length:690 start_codon:yes stop_codon:yes gene_type:complete
MAEQPQGIIDLKDTESGRLFFLGSGPSMLADMDSIRLLEAEKTWAVNKYPGWAERPVRNPTYYSITEARHCDRHGIGRFMFPDVSMTKFAIHWQRVRREGFTWALKTTVDRTIKETPYQGLESRLGPLTGAFNTILTSMQLALWMGYRDFYLIGNDMTLGGYAWDRSDDRMNIRQRQVDRAMWAYEKVRGLLKDKATMTDCSRGGQLSTRGILDYRPLDEVLAVTVESG